MKLSFSLKNKEANFEADVEGIVEKSLEHKAKTPIKKTRYEIKQEEKRKTKEAEHKQQLQWTYIMLGLLAFLVIFGVVATLLNI